MIRTKTTQNSVNVRLQSYLNSPEVYRTSVHPSQETGFRRSSFLQLFFFSLIFILFPLLLLLLFARQTSQCNGVRRLTIKCENHRKKKTRCQCNTKQKIKQNRNNTKLLGLIPQGYAPRQTGIKKTHNFTTPQA